MAANIIRKFEPVTIGRHSRVSDCHPFYSKIVHCSRCKISDWLAHAQCSVHVHMSIFNIWPDYRQKKIIISICIAPFHKCAHRAGHTVNYGENRRVFNEDLKILTEGAALISYFEGQTIPQVRCCNRKGTIRGHQRHPGWNFLFQRTLGWPQSPLEQEISAHPYSNEGCVTVHAVYWVIVRK